jgi:Fe2+ or Zn2+ uptake regulation protein
LNPAQIFAKAQAHYPGLGRATVYRTLELLTQLGLVRPIYVGEHGLTYIRAQGGHHHFVCARCGLFVDFDRCTADEIAADLAERFGFVISGHLLEFYGLCPHCKARGAQPPVE